MGDPRASPADPSRPRRGRASGQPPPSAAGPPGALAAFIEHTALGPRVDAAAVAALCAEAVHHGFVGVCVNGRHVPQAAAALAGSGVLTVATVVFPLGASTTATKAFEAREAAAAGAAEVDMVLPVGALCAGDAEAVRRDIAAVVAACAPRPVKVIVEACLLTPMQRDRACALAAAAGAAYVKTSTGFAGGGATVTDVVAMRACVGDQLGVKAAGGIRTAAAAWAMVHAGASRLGASASVAIVTAPA